MTAQINDTFRLRRKSYSLGGISEGELFDPCVLDLQPVGICSACWRGYQAEFGLHDSRLVLDGLRVYLPPTERDEPNGPVINGVSPRGPKRKVEFFNNYYEGLHFYFEYTGGLLLAEGFIKELYVHMGFIRPGSMSASWN